MREVERKFSVPDRFTLPDLGEAAPQPLRTLRATYHDTDDLRLAREGITLRHRTGEPGLPWQLKLPVSDGVRDELAYDGPAGEVPADVLALLTAWTRGAPLGPVATLRTTRRAVEVDGAEIVDDKVAVLDGRRVVGRFREIEVEARGDGGLDALDSLAKRLVAAGAVEGEFLPKVVRALGERAEAPPDLLPPPPVRRKGPAADAVTAALRSGVRRLLLNDTRYRRGLPDAVHQMRVACRTMRSDLRTFGPLVDAEWAEPLRADLSALAGTLGPVRDLEVLIERLRGTASAEPPIAVEPVLAVLGDRLGAAERAVHDFLEMPEYVALLGRLIAAANAPGLAPAASARADAALRPLVASAWEKLAAKARRLRASSPVDDFHRVRILAKRARYAAETTTPVLGACSRRAAKAAVAVQTVLGERQDASYAATTVEDVAHAHPELAYTAGRLVEREHALGKAAEQHFHAEWERLGAKRIAACLTS